MASKAQHVYVHLLHVNRKDARRLRGVYDEQNTMLPCNFPYRLQVYIVARQVRAVRNDNHLCRGAYRRLDVFRAYRSKPAASYNRKPGPAFRHLIERAEHGIMFQHRRHYMVPRSEEPFDCHV